uniref:Uncharacterized protein n=1 Tax=Arundo donax TaxID=35708 RepID=A0A0A8YRK1_ARUDO
MCLCFVCLEFSDLFLSLCCLCVNHHIFAQPKISYQVTWTPSNILSCTNHPSLLK